MIVGLTDNNNEVVMFARVQMCGSLNAQRCVDDATLFLDESSFIQMPEATTQLITDGSRSHLLAVGATQMTRFTSLPESTGRFRMYTNPLVATSETGAPPSGEIIAAVFHAAIAPDGQTIVATRSTMFESGESSASVDVIDFRTGNTLARSAFSSRNIGAVCLYTSDGSRMITTDMSLTSGLILWDGQVAGVISVATDSNMASGLISAISFSLDGTQIQTSHNATSSRVWNQLTLAEVAAADSMLFLPADATPAARYRNATIAVLEGTGIAIRSIPTNQLIHTVNIPVTSSSTFSGQSGSRIIAISWHPMGHRIAFTDGFRIFASTVIKGGRVSLHSVLMDGCTAFSQLGYVEGGAICIAGDSSVAVLNDVAIANCTATSMRGNAHGGALSLDGGLLSITSSRVTECSISAPLGSAFGGAISVFDGPLELESSVFKLNGIMSSNALVQGTALYYSSSYSRSVVSLCRFWSNFGPRRSFTSVAVMAVTPITWVCELGQYSPRVGDFSGSFTGCNFACAAGYYGQATDLQSSDCSGVCPANYYCPAGTAYPLSCPTGRSSPPAGVSLASCLTPRKASLAHVTADGVTVKLHKTAHGPAASTSVNVTLTIEGTSFAPAMWIIEEPTVPWLPLRSRVGHIEASAESQSEPISPHMCSPHAHGSVQT